MSRSWGYVAGEPPQRNEQLFKEGDEVATAVITLERNRRTFAWKCGDLDGEDLDVRVAASSLTLGGLLLHLAWVEELYFQQYVAGGPLMPPFNELDLDEWETWPWNRVMPGGPDAVRQLWVDSVHRSRATLTDVLERGGLEQNTPSGMNVRRILADMIEEYARHTGHADLIREQIDGRTGEDPAPDFPVP